MRAAVFLLFLLTVTAPAVAQRQPLGIFFRWGAYQEKGAQSCFAMAQPVNSAGPGAWRPFASVSFWPGQAIASQLHVRLSRPIRQGSAVIAKIDGRSFQLNGRGADAWAPNPSADAAIVAAMRPGANMSVESRSVPGGRIRERYLLRGAASAIDAAALACAARPAGKKPR